MPEKVFCETYSNAYDLLYKDKDYEAECNFLEEIFDKYDLNVKTILELGCGTGGHLIPLAKREYRVTGVDYSPHMLKHAREKIKQENIKAELIEGDICSIDLGRRFDAVISMFAVMSYQTTNEKISSVCRVASKHLNRPGVFIFDGWYGPGVLTNRPAPAVKKVKVDKREIVRFTEPVLDTFLHTVKINFKVWAIEDKQIISKEDEVHIMRYFFPQEMAYYLQIAGFDQINFFPFMNICGKLDESVWNMTVAGCA